MTIMPERPIEELQAGNAFRESLALRCNMISDGAPLWYGWAIMDAFLAGIDYRAPALDAKDAKIVRLKHDLAYRMHMAGEDKALLVEAMKALEIVQKENKRARRQFTNVSNNLISSAIDAVYTKLKAAGINANSSQSPQ